MPDASRGMVADIKRVFGGDFRVVRAEGRTADLRLTCFDAGDGDRAPRLAHSLKEIANMLGARLVAALADETELCLRQDASDFVVSHLAKECQSELASLPPGD